MRREQMRSDTKSISSGPMLVFCSFSHGEVGGLICCWRLQGAWERRGDNYTQKKATLCQDYLCGLLIKSPLKNKNPTAPWLMVPWQRIFLIKLLLTAKKSPAKSRDFTWFHLQFVRKRSSRPLRGRMLPALCLPWHCSWKVPTSSGSQCIILRLLRLRSF